MLGRRSARSCVQIDVGLLASAWVSISHFWNSDEGKDSKVDLGTIWFTHFESKKE